MVTHRLTKEHAMQLTATLIARPAVAAAASRWRAWLERAWHQLTIDADERFLREACDLADLEWRLQRLQRGRPERFGPLHPFT
jgi:hypothetical protein